VAPPKNNTSPLKADEALTVKKVEIIPSTHNKNAISKPAEFNSDLIDDLLGLNKKPIRRQKNK
jgi:hypothetical protein